MADAVVVADQSVDADKYAQSEEEQGIYLEKIHAAVAKIMNANL